MVSIYVADIQYPIASYKLPTSPNQVEEFKSSSILVTWLALCMNGSIGVTS
jgi:hypothetical protein